MIKNNKAKWIVRVLLLVGTAISLFYVPWILVKAWVLPIPDTVQDQVDEAIGFGFDGMIVYVDQGEKPPVFYTGGWKDRDNKIPAEPNSLFKIASISKLYTAVSITKLAKEKRLSLDDASLNVLKTIKMSPREYSEMMIDGPSTRFIGRFVLDPYSATIFSSSPLVYSQIREGVQAGQPLPDVIEKVAFGGDA